MIAFMITTDEMAVLERAANAPMLAQVLDWASINSGTCHLAGLRIMAQKLSDAFSILPGRLQMLAPDAEEQVDEAGQIHTIRRGEHLHLSVRPEAPVQLLLTGHMDTVFPADHPFQAVQRLDDGRLNGPGTADMKAGLAVMLAALQALEYSPLAPRIGYDLLINSDEETGSHASARLIAKLAKAKLAALTYEPATADGGLAGARPGSGNFSILIHGRSAHAGRNPQDGRNALIAAADLAIRLNHLKSDDLLVNPARIDGGGPNNVVPDFALLRLNMRPVHPHAMKASMAALQAAISAIERDHDVKAHLHGEFNRPPKPLSAAATRLFELVRHCGHDLDLNLAWKATGGVCDGNNIAACGIAVVDTMGPRGGAIHSPEEFLIVESLAERAQLSALSILRLAERGRL